MNGHLTKPLKIDELLAALGRILVFALCIFPGFGAFATEDGCVDLAPAGPVEGFESEDSGVEGVRKWLGLHGYADIESPTLSEATCGIRARVPCSSPMPN